MPTDEEFDDAVDDIGTCIEKIGDERHADAHRENDNRHIGYQCIHGPYTYTVVGDPSQEFFTVHFEYNIIEDFGGVIDESDAQEIVDRSGSEEGENDIAGLAAMEILESMSPSNKESLTYHLVQQLTNTDVGFAVQRTQSGAVVGFSTNRKIFPYEDAFSLSEFNHSVQTVVASGHGAMQFIAHSFDLESAISDQIEDEPEDDLDLRYIH